MASHSSSLDAPTRSGDVRSDSRVNTYWQPTLEKQRARKIDTSKIGGQAEPSNRGYPLPQQSRSQMGLPRPNMRSPSPTTRTTMDSQSSRQRFGFVGPPVKSPTQSSQPTSELKPKTSRNVLRRKQSSIAQHTGAARPTIDRAESASPTKWSQMSDGRPSIDASLKSAEAYTEIFARTRAKTPVSNEPQIYPELDRYRSRPEQSGSIDLPPKLSTTDLPPPTPLLSGTPLYSGSISSHHRYSGAYSVSGYSASPSTRFSESPGPGAFSRNTTPTSISSQSPGLVAPVKSMTPRLRQGSPAQTRPPVTRRRTGSNANENDIAAAIDLQGLPSLRESGLSSSSNSTGKEERKTPESNKKKKKRLSPLPPSPPPRKSSQKFKKSPSSKTEESPTKASTTPAKPVMMSPIQGPPIMKQLVPSKPSSKTAPPARPSRDGAPDLQSPLGDSIAIIQSNLSSVPFSPEKRRQSGIGRASPQIPQLAPNSAQGSRLPSRNPSPAPIQITHREATPAPGGLGIIPDLKPQVASKASGLRTPSPSLSSHKHRFGLFGRRTKTAPEAVLTEKVLRKGPAAGTGHEGYGRYAPRGRSTSAGSALSGRERSTSAASSSMESVSSTRTHDPFLLQRMSPVIIAGGEVIENHNTSSELARTESETSLPKGRPSVESKTSSKSNTGKDATRGGLWPSAMPKDTSKRTSTLAVPKGRRPSDSSDDGMATSSLAFRRSIGRFNNSTSALQLPKPLNMNGIGIGASTTSLNPSILSDDSQASMAEVGRGRKIQITKSKKLEKRPKSPKKWNIFHRSQPKAEVEAKPVAPVSVAVGRQPVKAVPHYALLDSSDEMPEYLEGVDLEDLMDDVNIVDLSDAELDRLQFGEMEANLKREREEKEKKMKEAKSKEEKLPTLLFATAAPSQASPKAPVAIVQKPTKEETPGRPSRLPQVGRIPKVVSARPQATSPKSFSRPFARLSVNQPLLAPLIIDTESVALGPSPPKPAAMFPEKNLQAEIEAAVELQKQKEAEESITDVLEATPADFLAFSPRKGSVVTTSSSGNISFSEVTTAVIPQPDAALAEDEIWDEYDDLIENDSSGKEKEKEKVPLSATSSHGVPFQYEGYETRRLRKSVSRPKDSPVLADMPKSKDMLTVDHDQTRVSILTASSIYSQEMSPKLKDAVAAIATPTTPMSFSEFISGYGDRNNSVQGDSAKKPRRSSRSSSRKSNSDSLHNQSQSGSGPGLVTITEQPTPIEAPSPISQVNLRLGSMTVSKWLTFGHVLFSPARESIKAAENDPSKRHSVLVIDGLGNDDWSFYAADIYPTATFYNLSPTRPLSASQRVSSSSSFPHTPPNHRQVQYLSPSLKFPFPSSTFHVVVFRFPPSLPLSSYQNVVSEAKRVLLPGGYLEMALLDVDMMNMGPRARRAVRSLKMTMQGKEGQSVWTGSASDTVLKHIGKRGFESVKTCVVGVPVATPISASSSATDKQSGNQQQDRSLAELIKDPHTTASDENITSMVAKVGRWWYNRCYEGASVDAGKTSIFEDPLLLAEGEEWQSSFKLVVLHARKPIAGGIRGGGRRRTLSV